MIQPLQAFVIEGVFFILCLGDSFVTEQLTKVSILEQIVDSTMVEFPSAKRDIIYLNAVKGLADIVARGRFEAQWTDTKFALMNFYGFVFAESGAGKDSIASFLAKTFFGGASVVYEADLADAHVGAVETLRKNAEKKYPSRGEKVSADLQIARQHYIKSHFPRMPELDLSDGTREGLIAERISLKTLGVGCTSIVISELAKQLRGIRANDTSFLDLVMEIYDTGNNKGKAVKGDSEKKTVERLPNNLLAYTTMDIVMKCPKKRQTFIELFLEGYARRSFIVYDQTKEVLPDFQSKDDWLKQNKSGQKKERTSYILQELSQLQTDVLKNVGHIVALDDDASYAVYEYEQSLLRRIESGQVSKPSKHEVKGRFWKALKLAGIFAVIQRKKMVDFQSVQDAINFTEHFGNYSVKFLDELTTEPSAIENMTDYIEELWNLAMKRQSDNGEKGYFNLGDVNKSLGRKASKSRKKELIEEMQDYAITQGYMFALTKIKKEERYMLEKLPRTEDVKVTLSLCADDHLSEGYKWVEGDECTLETALALTTCGNYSAGKFKGEHRSKADWQGGNTMLIFDVDTGTTIEEAKSMFIDTACAIMPTKSHQKEKNGVVCDRFRVFLPLAIPIDFTDAKQFTRIMKNVAESFNLSFDTATADPSRMFYRASDEAFNQTWFSDNALRLLDWRVFNHNTMGEQELKQVARMHNATFRAENKSKAFIGECVRKLCLNNYHDGNRNNTLFRALRWCRDAGFTQQESESLMLDITSASPLPVDEFKTTVRSAWR
jgi:hypothetical protein